MKATIIRHGRTQSNKARKYAGCNTDDHLTDEGKSELSPINADGRMMLFVSPMIRTRETAEIMFPGTDQIIIDDLKEMDFGVFDGRSHAEMDGDPVYQAWLDSWCMAKIPEGEDRASFDERTMAGFRKAVSVAAGENCEDIYIVAHGGTVMSLMSALTGEDYYSFHVDNGYGYTIELEVDDAGNITSAGAYDRFCGGILAGSCDR